MRRHIAYLKSLLRHKYFVFRAGLVIGVPIVSLIIHDYDKFLPEMWLPYARTFNKPNGEKQYEPDPMFDYAWLGHQNRNKHHWQRWVLLEDSGKIMPLMMPLRHAKEMLADWIGAGRAYGSESSTKEWYLKNSGKMILHQVTRAYIEWNLGIISFGEYQQVILENKA